MAFSRKSSPFVTIMACLALAACSVPGPGDAPDGIWDPHEDRNRRTHEFNKKVDKALLRPVSRAYVAVTPEGFRYNVNSLSDTLGTPNSILNQLLQGDLAAAGRNTARLAVNLVFGFGGIADPATELGLARDKSGFAETLYVWGVPEGAYREGLLSGPSTERDSAGSLVDFFLDPMGHVLHRPQSYYATGVKVLDNIGDRAALGSTLDSVLHDSADSYAQSRLIYLQNRRFELGDTTTAPISDDDPFALDTEGF